MLRAACRTEDPLAIRCRDEGGSDTERVILPLALVYTESCVTLLSWCCLREDFRMFRTDRIAGVGRAGTSFRPRRVVLLRDDVARRQARRSAGPANGPGPERSRPHATP